MKKKKGRLSKKEWEYIEENADTMSPEEIAEELNRDIEPIMKHISKIGKNPVKKENFQAQAEYDIKRSPMWKQIRDAFTPEEQELFLHHWSQIVGQFRRDILPTEELQIIDTIKLELLMAQALKEQHQVTQQRLEYEADIERERKLDIDERDMEQIYNLERQVAALRAAKESLFRDYKDLQDKKDKAFKAMKATREQRIQKLENNKETFSSLIRRLNDDVEFVRETNEYLEKTRLAAIKCYNDLSDFHTYVDGTVDQVILTPENVIVDVPQKIETEEPEMGV